VNADQIEFRESENGNAIPIFKTIDEIGISKEIWVFVKPKILIDLTLEDLHLDISSNVNLNLVKTEKVDSSHANIKKEEVPLKEVNPVVSQEIPIEKEQEEITENQTPPHTQTQEAPTLQNSVSIDERTNLESMNDRIKCLESIINEYSLKNEEKKNPSPSKEEKKFEEMKNQIRSDEEFARKLQQKRK